MVVKKLFSLQNEKNCLKRITLQKKLSASPKNGTPPPDKKIMVHPSVDKFDTASPKFVADQNF